VGSGVDLAEYRSGLVEQLRREIKDKRVLDAMARIPRERFIPPELVDSAYDDRPLSIGHGQTISQPLIVALMTQALELTGKEKVLEVGTGSGYQAAILAELAREVISVERIPQLASSVRQTLRGLGYQNVTVYEAGEDLGWPREAPYDAIVVTAGAPSVPQILLDQLAIGGRLVIPVGSRWEQELLKVTKRLDGTQTDKLGGCRFVPLIGKDAWKD